MNNITPKEAIEILSHYTDLGYGIVIEGEDTSKIKQALSLASKTLANGTPITEGDLIMFRTLMTEIANKGLPFEEVLLLIDNAKTPTDGDCISREALKKAIEEVEDNYDGYEPNDLGKFMCKVDEIIDNAQTVKFSLLPADESKEEAYMRGYNHGKIEGILKANARPQGEWIEYNATGKKQYMCSKCSMKEKNPKIARYCYWCGAKMKGRFVE